MRERVIHIEPTLKKSDLLSDNFKVAISPAIVSFFEKRKIGLVITFCVQFKYPH